MHQVLETGALGQLESLHSAEFFFVAGFCLVSYCFRRNWQEVPLMWGCPAITESYSHFFWTSKNTLSEALHILVSASREAIWTSSESEKNQNYDVWTLQLNYDVFTLQLDYASLQVRGWRKESFLDYKWSCGCIQKFHLCSKLIYSTQCLLIKYHQVDGTAVAIFNWGEGGGKKKYIFKNLFSSSALVSYMCIGHGDTSGITCFLYTI